MLCPSSSYGAVELGEDGGTVAGSEGPWWFRPGWRLRCLDPPIAWLQIVDEYPDVVGIRLQLTCYLTSRWASSVAVKSARLRIGHGEEHLLVWTRVSNVAGDPYPHKAGYKVGNEGAEHVLADFETDDADLIGALRSSGPPVPIVVEALLNAATHYRRIADLDLTPAAALHRRDGWRQVATGRELGRGKDSPPGSRGD